MLQVYSASAGSGKTYNLVLDYLTECFKPHLPTFLKLSDKTQYKCPSNTDYQHILAITFTNNAGAEMKERVVRMLNQLAFAKTADDLDSKDLENIGRKVFGKTTLSRQEQFRFLNENSKSLLHSILYDYARFSITTIDSFIQRVIRSSALYLNLSMNYAVQIRLTDFFQMAIEQYICELANNNPQFHVVVTELTRQLEDKGSANINRFLTKGLRLLYHDAEKSHPYVKNFLSMNDLLKVVDGWKSTRDKMLEQCKKELKPFVERSRSIFEAAESDGIMPNGQMKWHLWFDHLAEDPFNLTHKDGFEASRCRKEIKTSTIFTIPDKNKAEKARKERLKEEYADQIKSVFEQVQDIVLKKSKTYFSCHILSKNANYLLVLDALKNHIDTIKEQTDSFFLSESNPLLNDEILSDSHGDPLFEKFSFYKTFFIDEFQDTSLMQWQDLKPLIIEALSSSGKGKLTLFGDVKQSIYRFRNGEADLFYNLSNYNRLQSTDSERDIATMLNGQGQFHFEPLETNYRSQPSVVEFNNRFFEYYAKELSKTDYYDAVRQKMPDRKENGGLVQIFGYNKQDYKDIRQVWPECSDCFYQNVYLKLRPEEAELLYAVKDAKKRGYDYGDMAVLLSGRAKCNDFAQCLMRADVPVVTSESLQLCDNPNIDLIISTLRYLHNPSDTLAQTVILEYFCRKKQLDFYAVICANQKDRFCKIMEETFGIQDFISIIEHWQCNPFWITVKEIIRFYGFERDADPFVADFLDLVFDYTHTQTASVADFLVWWDDVNHYQETIPRLSLSGVSDAVRLMTIHASKGLEFPVVITHTTASNTREAYYWVTDPHSGQSCYVKHEKSMQFSDFQKEYEEEESKQILDGLNLWYVDFTRARDMLYLLAEFKESKTGGNSMNIKKGLKQFTENQENGVISKGDSIYYFGKFAWKKNDKTVREHSPRTDFRVACSGMTFCDNTSVKVVQSEETTESQNTGTRIHDFLQKLTLFPAKEEERTAAVASEPEAIRVRLLQLFEHTAQNPALRPYFYLNEGDQVLNEATVVRADGEVRRPDRIVIKPDHVMIIDYKTGREHHDKYKAQMSEYRDCLTDMGYADVRTEILYID